MRLKSNLLLATALTAVVNAQAMAVTAANVFTCSPGYVQDCALRETTIAGTEAVLPDGTAYEADYLVAYNFACDDDTDHTNIVMNAGKGDSHYGLYYGSHPEGFTLTGPGPLHLTDTNPAGSREELFSRCALTVSETHAPSSNQVQTWVTEETKGLLKNN